MAVDVFQNIWRHVLLPSVNSKGWSICFQFVKKFTETMHNLANVPGNFDNKHSAHNLLRIRRFAILRTELRINWLDVFLDAGIRVGAILVARCATSTIFWPVALRKGSHKLALRRFPEESRNSHHFVSSTLRNASTPVFSWFVLELPGCHLVWTSRLDGISLGVFPLAFHTYSSSIQQATGPPTSSRLHAPWHGYFGLGTNQTRKIDRFLKTIWPHTSSYPSTFENS